MAMRLISSRSWRWSFSWIFQCSLASAFRSCVARHLCLQNLSRPSIKYMFFVGDVAVHLRLGLAINKTYTKIKRTLGFSETLDWFFLFCGWSKSKDAKRKIKRKTKNIHKRKLDWILITCSPATVPEKGACWRLIIVLKFVWTCKQTSHSS
jgi:hypothetical protein